MASSEIDTILVEFLSEWVKEWPIFTIRTVSSLEDAVFAYPFYVFPGETLRDALLRYALEEGSADLQRVLKEAIDATRA